MALGRPRGTPAPETFFVPTDRDQGHPGERRSAVRLARRHVVPLLLPRRRRVRVPDAAKGERRRGRFRRRHRRAARAARKSRRREGLDRRRAEPARRARQRADPAHPGEHAFPGSGVRRAAPGAGVLHGEDLPPTSKTCSTPTCAGTPTGPRVSEPRVSSVTITGPLPETAGARRIAQPPPAAGPARRRPPPGRRRPPPARTGSSQRWPVAPGAVPSPTPTWRSRSGCIARAPRGGGFEAGVELAVRGILVSPNFLFRFEDQPASVEPGTPYRISDLEMASRLSFFLWSSIPDDGAARPGRRRETARPGHTSGGKVRRMLADSRSQALVDNFAGQWLHIRNVPGFQPSPELLFHFDDNLRQAFEQETKLFFESIVRENRNVLDLLDADYTFLNERLARHYGIPGVLRRALPAGFAPARQRAARDPRPGLDTHRDVAIQPDVTGHSRQVDHGEHPRHAAAPAAAQRAGPRRGARPPQGAADARADGGPVAPIRCVRPATHRWTSWGSPSRTSTRSASGADLYGSGLPIDASAGIPRRHDVRRPERAARAAAEPCRRLPVDGDRPPC